ncbi:ABC transporter permease [Peptoniphilus sp. KCTC 25270]|uniref:ABC transporter permease n=1 Tax=Peptoniphilus sp. KCTC 25270 TaxID=2897414 RepID=UPI001E5ED16F|nr:ABC transporter permease [Peptoniphilus sp. KCTC 25270]MCD1148023.1 ABC transporter permease [Peptoniphilus sp. KCTC 25270]
MAKWMKKIYLGLMLLFLYLPIVVLIVFSFNDSKLRGVWAGFTLHWYTDLISDPIILQSFYYTILVAVVATVFSTILGTLSAIGIQQYRRKTQNLLLNVNYLPVLNPDIVTAVALMSLFGFIQMEQGLLTMILSHVVFCMPYVILNVLPKLNQLNKNVLEAAYDLGATPSYALRYVILPQIKPGIISGALMAFTLSVDDFIISFFTTGQGVSNLSITLYSMAKTGINPSMNAISTILFATVLILLLIINKKDIDLVKFEV